MQLTSDCCFEKQSCPLRGGREENRTTSWPGPLLSLDALAAGHTVRHNIGSWIPGVPGLKVDLVPTAFPWTVN